MPDRVNLRSPKVSKLSVNNLFLHAYDFFHFGFYNKKKLGITYDASHVNTYKQTILTILVETQHGNIKMLNLDQK